MGKFIIYTISLKASFIFMIYGNALAIPPATVGSFCPKDAVWDNINCKLTSTNQGNSTPNLYTPFTFNGAQFTNHHPYYSLYTSTCPEGSLLDGVHCLVGESPIGRKAIIVGKSFGFSKTAPQKCALLKPGSTDTNDPTFCFVKNIPLGWSGFVKADRFWYLASKPLSESSNEPSQWVLNYKKNDGPDRLFPSCFSENKKKLWKLLWSDEFDYHLNDEHCFHSKNETVNCVLKSFWGYESCNDVPKDWTINARKDWTRSQKNRFNGLVHLNKCRWLVFDQFNQWEYGSTQKISSLLPENIQVSNGILQMKTQVHPSTPGGWDCGRDITPAGTSGNVFSKNCQFSGATLTSKTFLPYTANNNPINADPKTRYIGTAAGYGRIEFRARINSIGHGAWPALWLFGDDPIPSNQGFGELDALEFLAETSSSSDQNQFLNGAASWGMAVQTIHTYEHDVDINSPKILKGLGLNRVHIPHVMDAVAVPINAGEWHTYAIEFEPNEIRMYVDRCLRSRMREGEPIYVEYWDRPQNPTDSDRYKIFHMPGNKKYHIIIGNPVSNANWLPSWYRASQLFPNTFKPTLFEVDYVRVYEPISFDTMPTKPINPSTFIK